MVTNTKKEMIPIAILTGYLGAGKTTLLNRLLSADHGKRIAVLVNDFGSINIDSKLIVGVEGETVTLSNGCICCTMRGDLIDAIAKIVQGENPPDYIVIECSGVSDPAQVVLTFNRSFLRNHIEIDSIVAVVDSEQFTAVKGNHEKLMREQIRVSDIVLLNKADLISKEDLKKAHEWVDTVIDKARIIETEFCNVPFGTIIGNATYNPQTAFDTSGPGVHAHSVEELNQHEHGDMSLVFATWSWESDEAVDLSAMRKTLDNLPKAIFRSKGIIYAREVPDKRIVLQLVGNRVSLTEGDAWGDTQPNTSIVVIGDIASVDQVALKEQFEKTRASAVPESEFTQMVDGVMKWLRIK